MRSAVGALDEVVKDDVRRAGGPPPAPPPVPKHRVLIMVPVLKHRLQGVGAEVGPPALDRLRSGCVRRMEVINAKAVHSLTENVVPRDFADAWEATLHTE